MVNLFFLNIFYIFAKKRTYDFTRKGKKLIALL